MIIKIDDREYEICPALAVVTCNLVAYCDKYNLPFSVYTSSINKVEFLTFGWTSQLVFKYQYHINKDFSDLGLLKEPLCTVRENSIKIVVDPNIGVDKFNKE